ncbi:hypothetical protein [Providencia rettgeri]|uniref:DinB/UmuC family translesion DNA polymerase n=1 Tax=Providencia rettgeri TaxID=587 RepID=UPI003D2C98BF
MLHAQIICSRSLDRKVADYELVRQLVCVFAEHAAEKLCEKKQYCRLVTLWVQSSFFLIMILTIIGKKPKHSFIPHKIRAILFRRSHFV